ncbi:MAG: hypothetical protein ACI828_000551 [Flavobacteriales bacterium]|jgi:hypothetical protein
MKQLLLLPIVALLFASCSQDIDTNTPGFQAKQNDTLLFRAIDARAFYNDQGNLIINGSTDIETMSFTIGLLNQSSEGLASGNGRGNVASFEDVEGNVFSTAGSGGVGKIRIRTNSDNSINATFDFTGVRNGRTMTFSQGVMYRVPIVEPFDPNGDDDDAGIPDSFTARVNTVSFNPTVIASALSGGVLTISGSTSTQDITLKFPSNTGAGDYDFTEAGAITGVYTVTAASGVSTSGQLKIISNDTAERIVKGQFVFDTGSFQITDGQFTINY